MDTSFILDSERITFAGQGRISTKHALADAWVVKSSELGITESLIHSRTHLGHLLKPGDLVLGSMYNATDDILCFNYSIKDNFCGDSTLDHEKLKHKR
ncbi:hypothetical protein AVEN_94184-1 [Araneus ventricosus]|uniref:60S ribosomal export protein NMD3 OB-fold domain-containing protein n=1 Tax=Araneus ventricosus TaxID=182803 RepID=A0A4Y2WFL1_ARAVE|nr:hypothetical protein AVEN_94184-1 [Araneus ventricosus]